MDNRPARNTYAVTEIGEKEFQRLLREYWWEIKPVIDPFQVALSFMNDLPRDELLAALRYRAVEVRSAIEARKLAMQAPWVDVKPRHVAELFRLAAAQAEAELRWIEEAIQKVERGELP